MRRKLYSKTFSAILSIAILFSLSPVALASSPGLENFQKINVYQDGKFTDVSPNNWYYDNVKFSYEIGIIKGSSENFFNANGNVTLAEAITMAARLNSIYRFGGESFTQGKPWYQCYVDYAEGSGIITQEYENYNMPVTRAQFADIFSRAFPAGVLAEKNQIQDGSIPDVLPSSPYYDGIYTLYRAGILGGYDEEGTFLPDKNLRRSEASAFVSRMVDESLRQSFSLGTAITYYEKDPTVPDFGVVVNASNCTETATKNSHTYTYHTSWFALNSLSDWQDLMRKEEFQIVDSYSQPGGYATVYQKGDVTVTAGISNYTYYIVEVAYDDFIEEPSFSSVDDLVDYINTYYGQVETPLGTYDVTTNIKVNNSSYNLYDWWIMSDMDRAATLFYELQYSINLNQEEKSQAIAALRQYQQEIYQLASENFPDKKLAGGFYSGYYKYPNLQVGYHSIYALTWMNYEPSKFIGILEDYYDSSITSFHWAPDQDDYDFGDL